ncbi:MAG: adaptor protein MecA [Lachnospiraceae bacterium]
MKLERISENQIHCILESTDLQARNIRPFELSYGSEKAKALFKEMLQKAGYELDFYAQNIPLMIETIPLENDRMILIITRIDEADELDTRFARFAPSQLETLDYDDTMDYFDEEDDLELFPSQPESLSTCETTSSQTAHIFAFSCLEEVSQAAKAICFRYRGTSTLYRDIRKDCYYLILHPANTVNTEYLPPLMAEYTCIHPRIPSEAYCQEHLQLIIPNDALEQLKKL